MAFVPLGKFSHVHLHQVNYEQWMMMAPLTVQSYQGNNMRFSWFASLQRPSPKVKLGETAGNHQKPSIHVQPPGVCWSMSPWSKSLPTLPTLALHRKLLDLLRWGPPMHGRQVHQVHRKTFVRFMARRGRLFWQTRVAHHCNSSPVTWTPELFSILLWRICPGKLT